jgi:hypothetical protein
MKHRYRYRLVPQISCMPRPDEIGKSGFHNRWPRYVGGSRHCCEVYVDLPLSFLFYLRVGDYEASATTRRSSRRTHSRSDVKKVAPNVVSSLSALLSPSSIPAPAASRV